MSLSSLAIALSRVKNKSMNQREIQWVVDHMSREQVEEMLRREEAAHQQGIAEGKASAIAKLLRKGAISREDARAVLGVDDEELDHILKKR